MEHTIELLTGYTDKEGKEHREVTFSKRLTVGDLILADNDPQGQNPTQYRDLILRKMITKFGDLKMPVDLRVMLSLDAVDREDLANQADVFLAKGAEGRHVEQPFGEDNSVRLLFGFDIDDTTYNVVHFGRLTTGNDQVAADNLQLGDGIAREVFLMGREITKITTSDGELSVEGPVELDRFKDLDASDIHLLRRVRQMARAFFRIKRAAVRRERDGESSPGTDAGNGHERSGDTESADVPNKELPQNAEGNARVAT